MVIPSRDHQSNLEFFHLDHPSPLQHQQQLNNPTLSSTAASMQKSLFQTIEPKPLPMNMTAKVETDIDPSRVFCRIDNNPMCLHTEIQYKTKLMKESSTALPCKLYSTIKYGLHFKTELLEDPDPHQTYVVSLQVMSRRKQQLLESDYNGKELFRGTSRTKMCFSGREGIADLSFRLGNLSFSKNPDELSLIVNITCGNETICSMKSCDFRVYCRKPNKKRPKPTKTLGKRSRPTSGVFESRKRSTNQDIIDFEKKLDELVHLKKSLARDEQEKVKQLLLRELARVFPGKMFPPSPQQNLPQQSLPQMTTDLCSIFG